jgi:signal transduction histidine kinase
MKKKLQVILSSSMFLLMLAGFTLYTFITYRHIYNGLVQQVVKDNRVVGKSVIKLLNETKISGKSPEEVAKSLQGICEDILLPNKGFLCAVGADGFLLAAPGLKQGMKVDMRDTRLFALNGETGARLLDLGKDNDFAGFAEMQQPLHTDIVVMLPIRSLGIRLMVHQNRGAVQERALGQIKPLILIGIGVALVLGLSTFLLVDRLVVRYENKLEHLNRELTQTNRELSGVNQQRKEFIHILSHDLTHSLKSILYESEKLPDKPALADKDSLQYCRKLIHAGASQSLGIINLVKQMQALEARKLSLELKPVDLRHLVDLAHKILERQFYQKKIQLINKVPEDLAVIAETHSLCNTVLTNLLSNAVKFSHRGSNVEVSASVEGEKVKLTIADSGIGMPPDILTNLFHITHETLRPGTRGENGTGFGMPMVKRLIEIYGGSISVDSSEQTNESGQCGTIVTILFARSSQGAQ